MVVAMAVSAAKEAAAAVMGATAVMAAAPEARGVEVGEKGLSPCW